VDGLEYNNLPKTVEKKVLQLMRSGCLCTRATKEGKNIKLTVIPSKSHNAAVFIVYMY
jgi:hypothetical protein